MSPIYRKFPVILLFFLCGSSIYAQEAAHRAIGRPKGSILSTFDSLEAHTGIRFFYKDSWLRNLSVPSFEKSVTLQAYLDACFQGTSISYVILFDYAVILLKDPKKDIDRFQFLERMRDQKKRVAIMTVGDSSNPTPSATVSGIVKDEKGKPLANVQITSFSDNAVYATDELGRYQLKLPSGQHILSFVLANFDELVLDVQIFSSGQLDVGLQEKAKMLDEVIISETFSSSARMGAVGVSLVELKRSPTFLGERDVIKQVQMQAGVTSVGEVSSGYNVRGGSADQNLVLLDGVTIFNPSHALGFFSAFNSETIKDVKLYKGAISAEYGSRVSSVMDIKTKDGDYQKWNGNGGIGLLSAHLSTSGPVIQDKVALAASVRSSYSDWALKMLKSNYKDLGSASVKFWDANIKVSTKPDSRTRFVVAGYKSYDYFRMPGDTAYSWTNESMSLTIQRNLSSAFFGSLRLSCGSYNNYLKNENDRAGFDLHFRNTYPSLQIDFNREGSHKLSFGSHVTAYFVNRGELSYVNNHPDGVRLPEDKAGEAALYISDGFYPLPRLYLEAGLRYSAYGIFGPSSYVQYQAGRERSATTAVDTVFFEGGEASRYYHGLEPRLSAAFTISDAVKAKAAYSRVYQYLHLISNTAAVNPVDVWQLSNPFFAPQIGDQISLGMSHQKPSQQLAINVEGFYKWVQHILEYKDGEELLMNPYLERAVLPGRSFSYGVEFSAERNAGRLTGSLNYTFSRSFRVVDSGAELFQINQGKAYPSNYDQPHIANVNCRYSISKRIYLSGNFVWKTGRPFSAPIASYTVNNVGVTHFSERNAVRLPDYHRLDLALIVEGSHRRSQKIKGNWVFSFYNVYARRNAYSAFFKTNEDGELKAYQLSVVGSIIPTVSYSFSF